ncbi:hypothetical protein Bca52824_024871 [Brassica carinata]|uniref:GTD-binding domain-containing protein n=1 Tax=Brassica carinata TaxID=52824 RepID=A0A8X8AU85_BRACI|nr:hypothetical protein Bca52824_024871 [Brassica carinata]
MSITFFKNFVEQEFGSFPKFLIYTILEWILIATLFVNGLLAYLSNQFARFFDLDTPCLLHQDRPHPQFYYNDSIGDSHKKKIKYMCEGCLLSFATEKESDCDTYKSLIGILHKDLELLIDDERDLPFALKKEDNFVQTTTNLVDGKTSNNNIEKDSLKQHCSCCGELLKTRSEQLSKSNTSFLAPAPSPRVSELKDADVDRTPSFVRGGNKFFGIPLSDSVQNRPRWSVRSLRKSSLDKTDMADSNGETILNQLKKEDRLERKRSASAVAANNAMTMITRLQAGKLAIQMEVLQYQRMMDEQAEYDQEALQSMSSELAKREEEMKELEAELEAYRERYGCLTNDEASREEFLEEHGNSSADYDCQEAKPVNETVFCFSNHAENIDQNGSCKESSVLVQMESSEESTSEKGNVSKEDIVKELSGITERLSALQSNGELSKHMADVLDVSEGEAILLQISQNLHMLRSFVAMPSES